MTYFYNFGTPFISLEQTELETSSLVCRLIVEPSNQKNAKLGQKWRGVRHVTYFYNFGTPLYLRHLGIFIEAASSLKRSLDNAKRSFYRSFNSIFGRVGRVASNEVIIQLLKSKCLPV